MAVSPVVETYHSVEAMIQGIVVGFMRRYPFLDNEDLWSEARLGFMQAYESYDPDVAAFTTHVWNRVTRQLQDHLRTLAREAARPVIYGLDLDLLTGPSGPAFDVNDWLDGLRDDCRQAASMVLHPNRKLTKMVKTMGGDTAANVRTAVRMSLKDAGWSGVRIKEAFRDIKRSL